MKNKKRSNDLELLFDLRLCFLALALHKIPWSEVIREASMGLQPSSLKKREKKCLVCTHQIPFQCSETVYLFENCKIEVCKCLQIRMV